MNAKMDNREKKAYLDRLKSWECELKTNKYGMQKYAERPIKLLKEMIEHRWPGTLN